MSATDEQALMAFAVPQSSLAVVGRYTVPPTWGVYKIEPQRPSSTRRYRLGNHPVREQELRAEFEVVTVIARHTTRQRAVDHAALLNAQRR